MKKQELLDLAADVKRAELVVFHCDLGDRFPDYVNLPTKLKDMLEKALLFQAENDKELT